MFAFRSPATHQDRTAEEGDAYTFYVVGMDTEIVRLDDMTGEPVAVVPFLSTETAEEHQERVDRVLRALNCSASLIAPKIAA